MMVTNIKSVEEGLAAALAALDAPIEVDDDKLLEESSKDIFRVYDLATDEVVFGQISRPKKGLFAFVEDVFIPPSLADKFKDQCPDLIVSVHCKKGPRGRVATGIVPLEEYLGWHPEVLEKLKAERIEDIKKARDREIKNARYDLERFNRMVEAVKEFGNLIEIREEYVNKGYGARGVTEYVFADPISILFSEKIVDALHGRHEDGCTGGYFHGRDVITIVEDGHTVRNSWMGPYTD